MKVLTDNFSNEILDKIENEQLRKIIEESLNNFSEREKRIIYMRIYENKLFSEIGKIESISKGRAWHIFQRIICQLRRCYLSEKFLKDNNFIS